MELKSLSHTHTQLLVDALTTLGLLRCYGLEFGSPKVGTAGSGGARFLHKLRFKRDRRLLHPNRPTWAKKLSHTPDPDLSLDAEWTIGTDHLQSDHLPLHLVLHKADPTPAEIDTSPKFLYHKADWELLALKLTSECENHDPRDPDINTHYENIRSMILRAAEATFPKKIPWHQRSAPTFRSVVERRVCQIYQSQKTGPSPLPEKPV
ncbi:hypothetical protein ACOMHN_021888 [Nucella lapillus]